MSSTILIIVKVSY